MKSLKSLTEHLRSLQLINDDAFDSWIEKGALEYSGAVQTCGFEAPVRLYVRLEYLAILSWEAWHGSANELFFQVIKWLVANDYDFDRYGFPTFTAGVPDDEVADVQIEIRFEDPIYESQGVRVDEPTPSLVDALSLGGG